MDCFGERAGLLASVQGAFSGLPIQFLAANAGVMFTGSTVLSGTEAEWRTTYDVNVLGAFAPSAPFSKSHSHEQLVRY